MKKKKPLIIPFFFTLADRPVFPFIIFVHLPIHVSFSWWTCSARGTHGGRLLLPHRWTWSILLFNFLVDVGATGKFLRLRRWQRFIVQSLTFYRSPTGKFLRWKNVVCGARLERLVFFCHHGGESLLREKKIECVSKKFVVIVNKPKLVDYVDVNDLAMPVKILP
ncbi:hypothetical protein L1887_27711 [Cichorium endivia]|nr:hypothetical protein L1887_27711 [Cichorium endivia]